jgi:hypothetical protein
MMLIIALRRFLTNSKIIKRKPEYMKITAVEQVKLLLNTPFLLMPIFIFTETISYIIKIISLSVRLSVKLIKFLFLLFIIIFFLTYFLSDVVYAQSEITNTNDSVSWSQFIYNNIIIMIRKLSASKTDIVVIPIGHVYEPVDDLITVKEILVNDLIDQEYERNMNVLEGSLKIKSETMGLVLEERVQELLEIELKYSQIMAQLEANLEN